MMTVDYSVEQKSENMEEKGGVCALVAVGMRASEGGTWCCPQGRALSP